MAKRGDNSESQFNARADNAALNLRQSLLNQGRQIPDRASVEVGPDGKPPAPPPPEGSYISMALNQQRPHPDQERQQVTMPADERPLRAEEVVQAQEPPPSPPPQDTPEQEPSGNANRRIKELVDELRAKDQQLQQVIAQSKSQDDSVAELRAKLDAITNQHEQLLRQNLDHLDPETRMQVIQDARVQELVTNMERRILGQLQPHLQRFERHTVRSEMERLSDKYPAFDVNVHGPLIDMFRGKNPACTVEQAFRAIAEPEELSLATAGASVVPPIVPPGSGRGAQQRFAPEPESRRDPDSELAEEAASLREAAREGKATTRDWHEHLKRRLGG